MPTNEHLVLCSGASAKPRGDEKPRTCPLCKSANWDRPKKFERKPKGKK